MLEDIIMASKIVSQNEMASITINKLVSTLTNVYKKMIDEKINYRLFPSVMLWGQPGVGKSDAIKEIQNNLTELTNKKIVVTDVRLLLFNPIDLRGIPTVDKEKGTSIWLRPEIFNMDASDDVFNILFLDEISAAPPSVQSAAYQIVLDHKVGEHRLPDNCVVICAGNRVSDHSVAFKMPKALANRVLHFDILVDFKEWKKWALDREIDERVLSFLSFSPQSLNTFDGSNDEVAFATPRTWEMASNVLKLVSGEETSFPREMIEGIIGKKTCVEFITFLKVYKGLPNIEDIFDGKVKEVPQELDKLYAIANSIVNLSRTYYTDIKKMTNALQYINLMPSDFRILIVNELIYIRKDSVEILSKIPEFLNITSRNNKYLNGR